MKKKLLACIMTAAMVLSLAGCGGAANETAATVAAPTEAETVKAETETAKTEEGTEAAATTAAKAAEDVSIILVTMDGLDNHWVNVNKGAETAAKELGCKFQWMAPDKKDTALQIEMLNNATAAQCDGLVVAAVDPDAITATLQGAADAGVKIVYADSTSKFEALACYTTDNYAAAKTAGEEMIKGLKEKEITSGDIGIVAFSNATQTSIDREQGFRDAFKGTEYTLLETQYGNSEVAASQAAAENFISQGVVGVYGNNEPGAVGVGNAVAANAKWKGIAVGFDASETTLDLVDNGSLYSIMAQNPYQMGYGAVTAAFNAVQGNDIGEKLVDTGADVVTKDNTADFRAK